MTPTAPGGQRLAMLLSTPRASSTPTRDRLPDASGAEAGRHCPGRGAPALPLGSWEGTSMQTF